jgi:hypothetical protein
LARKVIAQEITYAEEKEYIQEIVYYLLEQGLANGRSLSVKVEVLDLLMVIE